MVIGPMASLVRSAVCRTGAAHRPYPSLFYIPGLRSMPIWHGDELTEILAPVLSALGHIREEYNQARELLPSDYLIQDGEHTLHKGAWEWRSLVTKGMMQAPFQACCPKTASVLQRMPDLCVGVPFAYAFFSTLKPGTVIAPHFGPANVRLRVHIPLIVPTSDVGQLGIEVAGTKRSWSEGQPFVFDDTYEHSVWSHTDKERVVLLFDVWHPDLSLEERANIVRMFDEARAQGWLT